MLGLGLLESLEVRVRGEGKGECEKKKLKIVVVFQSPLRELRALPFPNSPCSRMALQG